MAQEKAATENLVPAFNKAMKDHKTWHKMKKDPESKTTGYYAAKFDGKGAKRLVVRAVESEDDDSGWIKAIGFKDLGWVKRTTAIWNTWKQVLLIGRKLKPTEDEQKQFGPLCKRLFRYGLVLTISSGTRGTHALVLACTPFTL